MDRLELDRETMRRLGYQAVDRAVDRIADLDREPAWQWRARPAMAERFTGPAPEAPTDPAALLDRLATEVLPLASRVDHPRFFGYIPGGGTWPGVLGDFLASAYNIFAGTSQAAAGPEALELQVLDWFRQWVGLPEGTAGLLTSGGSAANLDALVCAREAWLADHHPDAAGDVAGAGDAGSAGDVAHDTARLVIYFSDQTHSSMLRAARITGFLAGQLRALPVDDGFRLRVDALREAVAADRAAGRIPFMVVANGGATSTGTVDPLPELAELCGAEGLWLHVDAAYGGFAVLTERGRAALAGIERADSVVLDPHKWLYQPFECGCLLVRQGRRLGEAFHIMPDYLQDIAMGAGEINFADRGLQLTRSARGLKVWLSLMSFGAAAFRETIDRSLDLAELAAQRVRAHDELEVLAPPALGCVCFRRHPAGVDDEATLERVNEALVHGLRESGLGFISSTRLRGRYALRVCVLNHGSTEDDVRRVVDWLATSPAPAR